MKIFVYYLLLCLGSICVDCACPIEVKSQAELDRSIDDVISFTSGSNDTRCIQWILTGSAYQLDLLKLMKINLQQNDSLIIQGHNGTMVDIDCVGGPSDLEEILNVTQPLSRASLIVLDSLNIMGCPVPILIEEVSKVMINNCDFQNHEHGAVNIYNCRDVTVTNCTFYNNTSSGYFSRKPYQGSSGGLSIGYNVLPLLNFDIISILVTDCNFTLNSVLTPVAITSPTQLISSTLFHARGGAVLIAVTIATLANCTVSNNVFVDNLAQRSTGALYLFTHFAGLHHFYCSHNLFMRNSSPDGGALLFLPAVAVGSSEFSVYFNVYNCTFHSNFGSTYAGAIVFNFFFSPNDNNVVIKNCIFYNNSGVNYAGAVDIVSLEFFSYRNTTPIRFENCIFDSNSAPDAAAINLVYYNAVMKNVSFVNHTGSTLRVITGRVELQGPVKFYSNNAIGFDGGAIYLLSYSQLFLQNDTQLEFINNIGSFGAAVVVETGHESIIEAYEQNFFNPLCFLQYHDPFISPSDFNNSEVSITFSGNRAITGPAIFTNQLDLCSWYTNYPPYFNDTSQVLRWPSISYNDNIVMGETGDTTIPVQTPAVNFTLINDSIKAYPGELMLLRIVPHDEQNSTTALLVEVVGNLANNNSEVAFSFNPSARILQPNDLTYPISYTVNTTEIFTKDVNSTQHTRITISSASEYSQHSETFELIITPCPPGHTLQSTDVNNEFECQCDDDNDDNIVNCLLKERRLILEEGVWAQAIDVGSINGILEYYQCPPGYCQCTRVDNGSNVCNSVYYYDNDDLQCVCDRKGYLCGQCHDDKGVSALLNNCVSCGYVNILLIITLVIVDVVVITGLLISTHITWSPWFYPSLYYLQVTPIVAQYFPVTFNAVQPYLHYISSAVSLYFPYDFCLYPGMTALASYSFRYIPLIVFIIVLSITFSLYRFNVKIFGQCRFSWNGLWLLIILLFTNVISTSVSILNCPRLKDQNGEASLRWHVDGTVECFTGGHAALAVFAILILAVCVILIVIVTVIAMGKLRNLWTVSFRKILQMSFTDQCKWWAPVELMIRLLFIISTLVFQRNLIPVLLCTIIYTAVYAYIQPFENQWVNILETTVQVDVLLTLVISSTAQFKQSVLNSDHSFSIDHCGQVDTISEHAAMLIPFYFFPLIILLAIITRTIILKVKEMVTSHIQRDRSQSIKAVRRESTHVVKKTNQSLELVFDEDNQLTVKMIKTID